jgi:hypothetical protein
VSACLHDIDGSLMPVTSLRLATAADRPVLERLWLMFRHDMSEFRGQLPAGDAWTEERRPVPGQPGLPPDVWIAFDVPA